MSEFNLYYLRNKNAGYLGNAYIWWCKNGRGYSAYLENAERMPKETAEKYVKQDPEKWEMFPCDLIDKRTHLVFDSQDRDYLRSAPDDDWRVVDASQILGRAA